MSRPKQKWTSEEEAALKAGVGKYGEGSWKRIREDPEFGPVLVNRTNVDLKDKWRNMKPNNYVSSSRRKGRTSCIPVIDDPLITCPEPCRSSLDKRRAPTYKAMIYQSLSSIDDPNGTDVNTMANFLESKYFLPYKFKRSLAATVRRLVHTGKLEKVNNRYKLKGLSSDAETSQEEDVGNVDNENEAPRESLQDAARVAAFQVAVAETKEYRVIKACEDKQKFAELLEASTAMLSFAVDLHEQCEKHGPMTLPPKVPFA